MKSGKKQSDYGLLENKVIHYALQLLALSLLIYFCFEIIKPFISLLLWSSVLAITLYPLHKRFTRLLKGRKWISATIITLVMFLFIIGPATMLTLATVDEFKVITEAYKEGRLQIPPPDETVRNWPVIGDNLYNLWNEASVNVKDMYIKYAEKINPVAFKLFDLLSSVGMGILLLMASFLVAGIMMVYGEKGAELANMFFARLVGKRGEAMENSVAITVRNVAKGVIGVAFIQGMLAGVGLIIAGVPLAGLWALLGMVLCIIQIGMMPVSVGVVIYIWTSADTTTAILLTIWMLFIGIIDNILKPIMMGIGAPAPMLV
ncbi:MAG TPA: AI-2E family transporter, partial [Draconibacterium sp.]|nr:AI-2E family transporter [Draconibacterium sp.]